MTKLTFLEASNGSRLGKTFTPTSVKAYPLVTEFNSHEYEVNSLTERFALLQEHAAKGHCMLRGDLQKMLVGESRRGQTNKHDPVDTFLLDLDGFALDTFRYPSGKLRANHVESICESIVDLLPPWFHNASYIGHASSSMGRNKSSGKVSVHIEFMLARPINPRMLKDYIHYLNLDVEQLTQQLALESTSTSLKFVLDPSVADNAHLIYIAPPVFQGGEENPFTDDAARFCLVEKNTEKLDLTGHVLAEDVSAWHGKAAKAFDSLRKALGLSLYRPKTKVYPTKEGKQSVVVNPDRTPLNMCHIDDEFARFNGTGKDNHMYWCHLSSPHIIHCWNGDDAFEFPKADPEGYAEFMDKYADNLERVQDSLAFVFRDAQQDTHFSALLDRDTDLFMEAPNGTNYPYATKKENLEAWLAERGQPMPDPIASYHFIYDPHETRSTNLTLDGFVNKYIAPTHIKKVVNIAPEFKGLKYDMNATTNNNGALLKQLCPNVYKIMWHMSGGTTREFEHLINWLAAVAGEKTPLHTTWIFSGTNGTGKGVFFDFILTPLLGSSNVVKKGFRALEDQFNSFLADKLLVAVDEFQLTDSRPDQKVYNYIKEITGSERINVRGMYKESDNLASFCNFLFFSNHTDIARLEEGDRRFNVGFPQGEKLLEAYPEFEHELDLVPSLLKEVPEFYAFLHHFDYNLANARKCLENEAKQSMRAAAMSTHQKFCFALRSGNLDYFVEALNAITTVPTHLLNMKQTANKTVQQWIKDSVDNIPSDVTIAEALAVYLTINPDSNTNSQRFSTMLTRNDVTKVRKRKGPNSKRQEYIITGFHFTEYEPSDFLTEDYQPRETEKVTCLPPTTFDPKSQRLQ